MTKDTTYLVDSDVFITAKNLYYAFGLCPGFWKSVLHHHRGGRIFSVDRVRGELLVVPRRRISCSGSRKRFRGSSFFRWMPMLS